MGVKLSDLPEPFRSQAARQLGVAVPGGGQKQDRQIALEQASDLPKLHTPCYLVVHVWRTGANWDADNIETKAILDGLVEAGILSGDTIKEVEGVYKEGHRCKTKAEERTVIELWATRSNKT